MHKAVYVIDIYVNVIQNEKKKQFVEIIFNKIIL